MTFPSQELAMSALSILLSATLGCVQPKNRETHWKLHEAAPKQEASTDPKVVSKKVLQVYRKTPFLGFTAYLSGRPFNAPEDYLLLRLRADVVMAQDKVKVQLFCGETLQDLLVAISIVGMEGKQLIYDGGKWKEMDFTADSPGEIGSIPNKTDRIGQYGCLHGSLLESWVGEKPPFPQFLSDGIEASAFVGTTNMSGFPCFVYLWDRGTDEDKYHRLDKFYVDATTFLLRQWDTLEAWEGSPPATNRSREYRDIVAAEKEPDAFSWPVTAQER